MFYNRATILEYLERYGEAIQNYNSAYVIDPSLQSDKLASKIVDFVIKTHNIVVSRSGSTQKKQMELVNSIPKKIEGVLRFPSHDEKDKPMAKYSVQNIADLQSENVGVILPCRILMHLDRP